MKTIGLLVVLCLATPLAWGEFLIARQGQTACVIVQSPAATGVDQHAAAELAWHLHLITGADFAIQTNAPAGITNTLIVGPGPLAAQRFPEIDLTRLGPEELVLRTHGSSVLLAGGAPRGTLYAVNHFLSDQCGVRWWTPWATNLPHQATLRVPHLNVRQQPVFEYREPFWFAGFDPLWKSRNNVNGVNAEPRRLPPALGGGITYQGFAHTFYPLVPPAKYFAAHPEWYSLVNGHRTAENAQLCLSNPQLRDFVTSQVRAMLRAAPDTKIISVSQNDCAGACQCPACQALDQAENSPAASVIAFVNDIAARIAAEFPGVAVDTFAYQYTRHPPRTLKPRANVIVRLCSIECNFRAPWDDPSNAAFLSDLKGWSKLCHRLYVWDYTTDFANYVLPHPNWFTLGPDARLFAQYHVHGVFSEGAYQGWGGEMGELRAWVLAQLFWNPQADDRALIQEFLTGYYGPNAGPLIQRYLELEYAAARGFYLGCYTRPRAPYRTFQVLSAAEQLWQQAEHAVTGDPELSARVRQAHLPVRLAWLRDWTRLRAECLAQKALWPLPNSRSAVARQFASVCAGVPDQEWTRVTVLNESGLTVDQFLAPCLADDQRNP